MNGSRTLATTDIVVVGMIAGSALAYEILLLRVFSYSQWSHFASIAVSLALLGFGIAGTVLAVLGKRGVKLGDRLFMYGIMVGAVGMLLAIVLPMFIQTRPLFAVWDLNELMKLLILDFVCLIPFFGIALSLGQVFVRWPEQTKRLYCANLTGSGLGAILPVVLLSMLFLEVALLIIPMILFLGGVIYGLRQQAVRKEAIGCLIGLILTGLWLCTKPPQLPVSDFKVYSYLLDLPDARIVSRHPGVVDQLTLIRSESIRIAPGLSLQWQTAIPPQDALIVGSDEVIPLQNPIRTSETGKYHESMLGYLPFILRPQGKIAILGTSEWIPVPATEGRDAIWIIDNGTVAQQMRKHYSVDTLDIHTGNPRRFIRQHSPSLSIVYFNDSFRSGTATNEETLLTVEGIRNALDALGPGGILAVPLNIQYPPRYSIKLMRMLNTVLRDAGINNPYGQVAILRSMQHALFLVSNQSFDISDIDRINSFAEQWNFDLIALQGLHLEQANRYHALPEPAHFLSAKAVLAKEGNIPDVADWYETRTATDFRPYFWHSMRWNKVPQLLQSFGRQGLIWLDWDILATLVKLFVAAVIAAIMILLPLGRLPKGKCPHTRMSIWLYFTALGFGFLLLEMAVFQRCNLYLANHIQSAATVFSLFLIGAGLGSLSTPDAFRKHAPAFIFLPIIGAAILAFVCLFQGTDFLLGLPLWLRLTLICLACLPLAFSLGRAFPWGLRQLDNNRLLIPWAWGINGFISVLAAPLATLLSVYFMQPVTWIVAISCYMGATATAFYWHNSV